MTENNEMSILMILVTYLFVTSTIHYVSGWNKLSQNYSGKRYRKSEKLLVLYFQSITLDFGINYMSYIRATICKDGVLLKPMFQFVPVVISPIFLKWEELNCVTDPRKFNGSKLIFRQKQVNVTLRGQLATSVFQMM